MIWNTFKANINVPGMINIPPPIGYESKIVPSRKQPKFKFSKEFIKFPPELVDPLANRNTYQYCGSYMVVDYMKYKNATKLDIGHPHRTKNSRFQITFDGGETVNLFMDRWNVFRFNCIHNRYWITKNGDWLFKAVITILLGAAVGLLARQVGYRDGFKEGLKAEKANTRQIPQQ